MTTFDKIIQMQTQGFNDQDIIQRLRNEGISPKEINDTLNQVKVKNAVSQAPENYPQGTMQQFEQTMQGDTIQQGIPMQDQNEQQFSTQAPQYVQQVQEQQYAQNSNQQYPPQEQQYEQQQQPQQPNPTEQEYQDYYPETPNAYSEESYYPQQNSQDPTTITEIAGQIVSDKFNEFSKKTGDIVSFKTHTEEKLKELNDRLKRIEDSIDSLQQGVIGKIREFSETTSHIHNDLNSLHDTMSKLMNPLVDNYKALKKLADKK